MDRAAAELWSSLWSCFFSFRSGVAYWLQHTVTGRTVQAGSSLWLKEWECVNHSGNPAVCEERIGPQWAAFAVCRCDLFWARVWITSNYLFMVIWCALGELKTWVFSLSNLNPTNVWPMGVGGFIWQMSSYDDACGGRWGPLLALGPKLLYYLPSLKWLAKIEQYWVTSFFFPSQTDLYRDSELKTATVFSHSRQMKNIGPVSLVTHSEQTRSNNKVRDT